MFFVTQKILAKLTSIHRQLLDKLVQSPIAARRLSELETNNKERVKRWVTTSDSGRISKILVLISTFLIVGFFCHQLLLFSQWPPKAYQNGKILNLTRSNIQWQVHYGSSKACGPIECHLSSGFSDANYERQQVLPIKEFPLKKYVPGQNIYYRTRVNLPENIIETAKNGTIVLHIFYIWGDLYEVYVNEARLLTDSNSMVHLPIPYQLIQGRNYLDLAVKVAPGSSKYQGIANYGEIVIGDRIHLDALKYVTRDYSISYFLWLVLPRLSFAFFFAFAFLAFSRNQENLHFVTFSILSSIKVLLYSDLVAEFLPAQFPKVLFAFYCDTLSQVVLILFFWKYFRRSENWVTTTIIRFFIPVLSIVTISFWFLRTVDYIFIYRFTGNTLRVVAVGLGWIFSIETALYLYKSARSPSRLRSAKMMFCLLSVVTVLTFYRIAIEVIPALSEKFIFSSGFITDICEIFLLFTLAAAVASEFGESNRQKEHSASTLGRYVGQDLASALLFNKNSNSPVLRDVTVLFTDIRSYSGMSESISPLDVIETLNDYFQRMVPIVEQHGGSVDKFIGDSIMVVWGAVNPDEQGPLKAVQCAIAMRKELVSLNQDRLVRMLQPLTVGIGIHAGQAVSGVIGSTNRQEYTVLGDTVNIASRIQDETKNAAFDILISDSIRRSVVDHCVYSTYLTKQLRGRIENITLFRLIASENRGLLDFGHAGIAAKFKNRGFPGKQLDLDPADIEALSGWVGLQSLQMQKLA